MSKNKKKKFWQKALKGGGMVSYVNGKEIKEPEKKETKFDSVKVFQVPDFREITAKGIGTVKEVEEGDLEFTSEISLILSLEVYNKIVTYTNLLSSEITGIGLIEKFSNNIFKVKELFLLKQVVSGSECEIDNIAICKLMDKIVSENKDPRMLRFWWHSHNSMGCNWSSTDETTGKKFAGTEYLISLVSSHNGEMKARMNIYNPIEIEIDNIKILAEVPKQEGNIIEKCKEEIRENVKEEKSYNNNVGYGYGVETHPLHQHQKTLFDKVEGEEETLDETDGPMGNIFYEKSLTFIWDSIDLRYKVYKRGTKDEISDYEAEEILGVNYNSPQWLGQDLYDAGFGY